MWHARLRRSTCGCWVAAALLAFSPDSAAAVRSLRSHSAASAHAGSGLPPLPVPATAPTVQVDNHEAPGQAALQDLHPFSPEHQHHYDLVPIGAAVILYGVTCCVVLAASALMVCCMYDTAAHWCHRSHFLSCQSKVQRVHEVFFKRRGEPMMCPYCVEFISSSKRMSQPVVFLCGHRFHMECANKWFREYPEKSGCCPLCEGAHRVTKAEAVSENAGQSAEPLALAGRVDQVCGFCEADPSPVESGNDEALAFMLGRLRKEFPEIISEECHKRWSSCHTEIWLSELRCPKYNSLLQKQLG